MTGVDPTGDQDASTLDPRVRQVIERAPALTTEQLDQLRSLLPPPPAEETTDLA